MILILSILFLGAASALPNDGGRIVNGTDAKEGEYPYVVSLRSYGSHSCGGSIINERFILTAAHCVYGRENKPELFTILYGNLKLSPSNKEDIRQVIKVTMHPKYVQGYDYRNDVAVLELEKDIIMSDKTKPVALAEADPGENAEAILVGWGYPYSGGGVMNNLQKVPITLFTDKICESTETRYSSEYHVCAGLAEGGKGQCSGDSGGPLTVNGIQYGIVSWSVKPCATKGHPGIFAKVSKYRVFISEVIA